MKKWVERVNEFAKTYGWGATLAAAPYVNVALLATTGLAIYLVVVLLHTLGVEIRPPEQGGGLLGSLLFLMAYILQGWAMWSYLMLFALIPGSFALSLAEMMTAKAESNAKKYTGAVAGVVLSGVPLLLYLVSVLNSR
jgi:hypothetical protein